MNKVTKKLLLRRSKKKGVEFVCNNLKLIQYGYIEVKKNFFLNFLLFYFAKRDSLSTNVRRFNAFRLDLNLIVWTISTVSIMILEYAF